MTEICSPRGRPVPVFLSRPPWEVSSRPCSGDKGGARRWFGRKSAWNKVCMEQTWNRGGHGESGRRAAGEESVSAWRTPVRGVRACCGWFDFIPSGGS